MTTMPDPLPPFDDSVPTAPLVTVHMVDLQSKFGTGRDDLFNASKDLGFFYLDLHDSHVGERLLAAAAKLNDLQMRFFALDKDEKDRYRKDKYDPFYAYRFVETTRMDPDGRHSRNESLNIKKDDILGNSKQRLPLPDMLLAPEADALFKTFTLCSRKIIETMFEIFEDKLHLPRGTIGDLHQIHRPSGDHVRFNLSAPASYSREVAELSEHTDFGSITVLLNWVGGLQIRLPDTEEWVWVKPRPGCAIINLGDAMVKFTAGILRSNVHRVVAPSGAQADCPRPSLVYFSRPEDDIVMERLKGGLIDEQPVRDGDEKKMSSKEWILARSNGELKGIYTKNGLESRPRYPSRPLQVD